MGKELILVVDDDEDILELVRMALLKERYDVICADSAERGWELLTSRLPTLTILDWMLPGMDGLELCKVIKRHPKTANTLVVMLSAKGEEADIVAGLEVGADEYVTKPFSPKVLVARVRKVLRKKVEPSQDMQRLEIHDLVIDPMRREAWVEKKPLKLTFSEFNILWTLAQQPGVVLSRYQIVDNVRGSDYVVSDRAVDVQIAYLRRKLGQHKDYIETVRGVGYRFRER